MEQDVLRFLGTNTRKIKSNIDKYIGRTNNSNIYYQQEICVTFYIELTWNIFGLCTI